MKKISVVIPSYNKKRFIGKTLESITNQHYDNLEVIIQDGGSTDGTVDIIKKFAKKYPKVIAWESKRDKGQLDAINKGLAKATGDILTFINADDVYHKAALKNIGEYFEKYPKTMWLSGQGTVIDEKGKEVAKLVTAYKNILLQLNKLPLLLMVNYLMQPSVFISKKAYTKYGPFEGNNRYVLEYKLWLKMAKHKMPSVLNKNISMFRLDSQSFSLNQTSQILADDMQIVKEFTNNPLIIFLHYLHNLARKGFVA